MGGEPGGSAISLLVILRDAKSSSDDSTPLHDTSYRTVESVSPMLFTTPNDRLMTALIENITRYFRKCLDQVQIFDSLRHIFYSVGFKFFSDIVKTF